jgi:two-component system sensor histidine kinase KdpD
VVSAVTWDYVFIPPKLSFSVLDLDESLTLGAYFFAALIGGQLTARIRSQERKERQREQRASALFELTRALASGHTLDEAVAAALRQVDALFNARTALLLTRESGGLERHTASSLVLGEDEFAIAALAHERGQPAGRFSGDLASRANLHLPLRRGKLALGVMVVGLPPDVTELAPALRDLIDAFATQIALLIEREQLRAASEREQRVAESDRLHRTLLDSVSHELKTPLAILQSAAEKLDTDDAKKRAALTGEIRTATSRLDHLVANLLNQTRLEAGRVKPQLDWCDARDLFAAARRSVGAALQHHLVTVDIAADFPLIHVDAVLMEHVLANLLLNAGLHTRAGTAVRLSAGLEPTQRRVFLAVEDGGDGLPSGAHEQLFQKFQRGPSAPAGGLGLGLSIVRGFTLAQGGEVIASRSGLGGAGFTIYLPHLIHGGVPLDER